MKNPMNIPTSLEEATDEKIEQAITSLIREENESIALPHKPEQKFEKILELYPDKTIRKFGKAASVRGYTRMQVLDLRKAIVQRWQDPERLESLLMYMGEHEWKIFQQLVAPLPEAPNALRGPTEDEDIFFQSMPLLRGMGLVHLFLDGEKLFFVIPDEIQKTWRAIDQAPFVQEKAWVGQVARYARAAMNLYGFLTLEAFAELYRHYGADEPIDRLKEALSIREVELNGFWLCEEGIVSDGFEKDELKDVKSLVKDRAGKPMYRPGKTEFLRYEDVDYIAPTPAVDALADFLQQSLGLDEDDAMDAVEEVYDIISGDWPMQKAVDALFECLPQKPTMQQVQELIPLLVDLSNHSRRWSNFGHTPDELSLGMKKNRPWQGEIAMDTLPEEPIRVEVRPGRNDLCPCGSGKKYKKCCGAQ